jgi:Cu2+-exporting ATPase
MLRGVSVEAPARATACSHCRLPVSADLLVEGAREQFCCAGCRTVHAALREWGLDSGWERRLLESGAAPQRARATGRGFEEFDDPALLAACGVLRDGNGVAELYLEGVHCAACAWLVERLPRVVPGVQSARLDLSRGVAEVRWDAARVPLSAVARGLDRLGYPPHPARAGEVERRRAEDRRELLRLGVAGAIAMNLMGLAFALYGRWFHGMDAATASFLRAISCALAALALVWPGRVFLRGAWASLRARAPHLDLPIALGLLAGWSGGAWNVLRGAGEVYFEGLGMLVFLLLAGRFLQRRQQRRAHDALALLHALAPATARLLGADGVAKVVPVAALRSGERVEVRAGEAVPADGRIVAGRSEFDLSLLTGESRPVALGPGDRAHAGTTSLAARVEVAVEATGAETRVGRIAALVERAAAERAPIVQAADRLAGWFTAAVVLAAGTLVWFARGLGMDVALDRAVALLIVACPCALGLATPLALTAAIGRLARRGILVKGGAALERLARPGVLLLDKTGTLTEGRLRLLAWSGSARDGARLAALETGVAGPHAEALRALAPPEAAAVIVNHFRHWPGRGVSGHVDGCTLLAGTPAFLAEHGVAVPADALARATAAARTPVALAVDGAFAGIAELGDRLRAGTAEALQSLREAGWELRILSGDHPAVVAAVAAELGIVPEAARGGATPEEKVAAVRAARAAAAGRPVVMIGDGVNDAAALAAADVGVAVHGGAEASLEAADAHLAAPDRGPAAIVELIGGARGALRSIRLCLVVSIAYNLLGAGLAAAGLISPVLAAVLMPVSSLTVTALAFRR